MKRQATDSEKILANYMSDKEFASRTYKKLNNTSTQFLKGQKA